MRLSLDRKRQMSLYTNIMIKSILSCLMMNQEEGTEARILLISKAITSQKKNGSVKVIKEEKKGLHVSCFPKL